MTAAVLINGVTPRRPVHALAVEDRGLQYGDGVFETALLAHGRVRLLEHHLHRLARAASGWVSRRRRCSAARRTCTRLSGRRTTRGAQDRRVARHRSARLSRHRRGADDARRRTLSARRRRRRARLALRWCEMRLGSQCAARRHQASQSARTGARAAEWHDGDRRRTDARYRGRAWSAAPRATSSWCAKACWLRRPALLRSRRHHARRSAARGAGARHCGQRRAAVAARRRDASEVFLTNAVRGVRSVNELGSLRWDSAPVARPAAQGAGLLMRRLLRYPGNPHRARRDRRGRALRGGATDGCSSRLQVCRNGRRSKCPRGATCARARQSSARARSARSAGRLDRVVAAHAPRRRVEERAIRTAAAADTRGILLSCSLEGRSSSTRITFIEGSTFADVRNALVANRSRSQQNRERKR